MSSPDKYITLRSVDTFWSHENELVFEGMSYCNELYSVSIPIHEITDSLDFIIKKRIEHITNEKRNLNQEQRELKVKLKAFNDINNEY